MSNSKRSIFSVLALEISKTWLAYGWHVVKILEKHETPGWAFSVGLYKNFNHPEIVVFGLNDEVAHKFDWGCSSRW
jgi:hypothetical protein